MLNTNKHQQIQIQLLDISQSQTTNMSKTGDENMSICSLPYKSIIVQVDDEWVKTSDDNVQAKVKLMPVDQ